MDTATLSKIEASIYQLSLDEPLWLIERLAQHIRTTVVTPDNFEAELAAMANDPQIQSELQMIEGRSD